MYAPALRTSLAEGPCATPRSTRSPRPSFTSDPHSVQLSHYDGRLLMDRDEVPEGEGFDDDSGADGSRKWSSAHHSLVALVFVAAAVAYAVVLLILTLSYDWQDHAPAWSVAVSAQLLLLIAGLLLELLLKRVHRLLREDGHLLVYRATKGLIRYPFRICAITTAFLMILGAWPNLGTSFIAPWPLLVAVATAQALAVALWAAVYSYRVWQYSHGGLQMPDAETDLANGLSAWDRTDRSGYFARGAAKGSAQQAELIRYLHRQRDSLSRELLRLHTLLERRDGSPRSESAPREAEDQSGAVLAAQAAEARAAATADMLRRETRSAMVLLDEKQAALSKLEAVQEQQVKENARLRSALAEWSAANRRLEHKLNEQLSKHTS